MLTIYISIGNSDDKLPQRAWANYVAEVGNVIHDRSARIHGAWYSGPTSAFQNCCWCFEATPENAALLRLALTEIRKGHGQDSVAWAPVIGTDFI